MTKTPLKLSEIVEAIMASGASFTDIHIQTDMEIMLRRAQYDWVPAKINDEPVYADKSAITAFLNAVFTGDESVPRNEGRSPIWKEALTRQCSLHPAVNISRLEGNELGASFRMRCTVQKQAMGEALGLVLRPVPEVPESVESLGLPIQVSKMLTATHRGLIIVTGPTGSGKSTSLAAMVGELNRTRNGNIITIEDPVEYIHDRNKCIINQREIGVDVNSFADGVRDALRFVPDVILIGEIRDAETMRQAVRATESGHLVLASMHAPSTVSAIRKMLAYLSDSQADMQSLAYLLVGVIAQALVKNKNNSGDNHLASEYLDCREGNVVKAISGSVGGDTSFKPLAALEQEMISGDPREFAVPMVQSLRSLIQRGLIDAQSAIAVVTTNDEKEAIHKIVRR